MRLTKEAEGGESELLISRKQIITDSVIKNLLSAHKRIADQGNVSEIIRLSKFLFRLADQGKDVLVNIFPEDKQEGCNNPVEQLEQLDNQALSADSQVFQHGSGEK